MLKARSLAFFRRYFKTENLLKQEMSKGRYFLNSLPDFHNNLVVISNEELKNRIVEISNNILAKFVPDVSNCDGGLYVGTAGISYTFYHLSKSPLFNDKEKEAFLKHSLEYLKPSLEFTKSRENIKSERSAFLLGNAGTYAVAAVLFKCTGDLTKSEYYRAQYEAAVANCRPANFLRCGGDEFFVGRAGYICGALWMSKELNMEAVATTELISICESIVMSGEQYSRRHDYDIPLMYSYYNMEYLGAAHGLAFILQMLMSTPKFLETHPAEAEMIKRSVDYLLNMQTKAGNFPSALDEVDTDSRPGNEELVHWCHGGPGVIYTMAKAYLLWKDEKYLNACLKCGDLVWEKGLLKKGPGICHGVAGNAYVFLLLYRLTMEKKQLHRALMFAEFLKSSEFKCDARVPDSPFSLYEGLAGTACFLADLAVPTEAAFPFQNVFAC